MALVSIAAKKKVAVANDEDSRMRDMPRKEGASRHPLAELIASRVDAGVPNRMTYEEVATRSGGRISGNYVNELRNGIKEPSRISVAKIVGLAKAFGESPVVVFEAAMGKPQNHIRDESLEQLLIDFSELPARDRQELRYIVEHLHAQIQERKAKSGRGEISSR